MEKQIEEELNADLKGALDVADDLKQTDIESFIRKSFFFSIYSF
jgi:hypothetical protein